jgi:hypothetical protein
MDKWYFERPFLEFGTSLPTNKISLFEICPFGIWNLTIWNLEFGI